LIQVDKLKEALTLLKKRSYDSVFPIVRFGYPIQRALIYSNGHTYWMNDENAFKRSQDLPKAFHDAGQFYWFKTENFIKTNLLTTKNSGAIILSEMEVQDIDDLTDWTLCEVKYKLLNE